MMDAKLRKLSLEEETFRLTHSEALVRDGQSMRTLFREGSLGVILVTLGAGEQITQCSTEGPVTLQPVYGRVLVWAGETRRSVEPGDLLSIPAGVTHSVQTPFGGVFLLTTTLSARETDDASSEVEDLVPVG